MSKRSRLYLIISAVVIISCSVLASGFPTTLSNLTGDFYSQVSAVLGVKAEAAPIVFADDVAAVNSFHFLPPIAPVSGDSSKFDPKLLKQLKVEVCEVKSGGDCTLIKTFTNNSAGSEQLRIEKSYYVANWDTAYQYPNDRTYRIKVSLPLLLLGSVDLTPDVYTRFGRTWPIKFLIEKDPVLRVRQLRSLGRSAASIANALKLEFNLTREQIVALLLADVEPFTQEEIDVALDGIFQNVIVPFTTKVADEDTNAALTSFDPSSGRMTFGIGTSVLKNLNIGDVLVGEPTPTAPYGYLRKVTFIRKNGGGYVIDTVQAKINEAISKGTLQASGELKPTDVMSSSAGPQPAAERSELAGTEPANAGDGFSFHRDIDITINLASEPGDVSGTGTVRVQGFVDFNAGYDFGVGIETCAEVPPVCVDRVEAHVNVTQKSYIKINGQFDGYLHKERTIDTIRFAPITFFLGPIPVIIYPVIDVIVGVDGEAHATFRFEAEANSTLALGAKWTDPNDGGQGWQDIKQFNPLTGRVIDSDLTANLTVEGYGKANAKLLLYGVAGPGMGAAVGLKVHVQFGQKPLWTIDGHLVGDVNFSVDIASVIDLANYSKKVIDASFRLGQATNQIPNCNWASPINADVSVLKTIGPTSGFEGHFTCTDPEGESITYSATSNLDGVIASNVGVVKYAFPDARQRTLTITARDASGGTRSFMMVVDVRNALPIVTINPGPASIPATVQYFVTATAYDPESGATNPNLGFLGCDKIEFSATHSSSVTKFGSGGTCGAVITFNVEGPATVTAKATDPHGGVGTASISVNVTPEPVNHPPTISTSFFKVYAYRGPFSIECPDVNFYCVAPNGAVLNNGDPGSGLYYTPLLLDIGVISDQDGDQLTTEWHCVTGAQEAVIGYNAAYDFPTCTPSPSDIDTIFVYAYVSDGVNRVKSPVMSYRMFFPVR